MFTTRVWGAARLPSRDAHGLGGVPLPRMPASIALLGVPLLPFITIRMLASVALRINEPTEGAYISYTTPVDISPDLHVLRLPKSATACRNRWPCNLKPSILYETSRRRGHDWWTIFSDHTINFTHVPKRSTVGRPSHTKGVSSFKMHTNFPTVRNNSSSIAGSVTIHLLLSHSLTSSP